MKKYILSAAILFAAFSCNDTAKQSEVTAPPATDSTPAKTDSAVPGTNAAKTDSNLTIGLTQEEMKDDSVFTDGSIPSSWEIAGITDVKEFKLFLKQVQLLVMDNEKEKLAKLIKYPLNKNVKTEADFIKDYDRIFSKDAKLSIARINFSQVFRNVKGAMSEDGKVWFAQEGREFKIIAINS